MGSNGMAGLPHVVVAQRDKSGKAAGGRSTTSYPHTFGVFWPDPLPTSAGMCLFCLRMIFSENRVPLFGIMR
jgi:hypothetical protein